MADHIDTGLRGEEIAADYVVRRGWEVLERRWRDTAAGGSKTDVDIIALSPDGVYHFVEVKTRTGISSGRGDFSPETAVTPAKMQRMIQCAERYMAARGSESEISVDLAAVTGDEADFPVIRYYSDIAR